MRGNRSLLLGVLVALMVVFGATAATAAGPQAPTTIKGRYLVVFKAETLPADAIQRVTSRGGTVNQTFHDIGVVSVISDEGFASRVSKDRGILSVGPEHVFAPPTVQAIEFNEEIAVAEDAPVPAEDVYYPYQWDMRRVGAPDVWDRFPLPGETPRVAVLDTGVMYTHPDLVGQVDASVATSYCPTFGAYPYYGEYIDFDTYPEWAPGDGCSSFGGGVVIRTHGTHVAGTIASKFGGGRTVGVAPNAVVGAYKVFDVYLYEGQLRVGAFDGPIFQAIIQATQAGYPVINMSLGSYLVRNDKSDNASYLAWDRIAKWANRNGTLIVASAGNGETNLNGNLVHIPSDLPTVISTSATAAGYLMGPPYEVLPGTDYLASYSNYGAAVDIAAPGGDCPPDPTPCDSWYWILNAGINEKTGAATYYLMTGTSMATPHVSAVAALVRALNPYWTPGAVRSWLKDTAEQIGSRQMFGHGMVDASAATQ